MEISIDPLATRSGQPRSTLSERLELLLGFCIGGEGGIRTLDTLLTYTHFPGVRLQPLGHLSNTL